MRALQSSWKTKLSGLQALWQFDNRWQLIVNRLFFDRKSRLFYRIGNLDFLVDHGAGDTNGARLCVASTVYKRFLPKMRLGDSVSLFDLGANSGGFPLLLLASGKRLSKVVCVEMNPNTFLRLQFNILSNVRGEVSLIQGAVCGRRTEFELSLGPGSTSDSIYQDKGQDVEGTSQKVQGYSFDELFETYFATDVVDICKLDVEGAEYEILASGECTRLAHCRYVVIELHRRSGDEELACRDRLSGFGFSEVPVENVATRAEYLFRNEKLR